ncbi:MAG: hypothetical protein ACHQ52_02360 [Candidatus Eisenbacteria bacterium]
MSFVQSIKRQFGAVALAVIVSVAAVATYVYVGQIDQPNFEGRLALHRQILDGTAVAPYRYRILVPLMCEALVRLLSTVLTLKQSFLLAYAVYDAAAILFLLIVLFAWFRALFSREQSLLGVLFVVAVMPMALRGHYYQPWSLLEPGLFTASLLSIYRRRYWLLALITAVATLNRETGIFIPLAFLLSNVDIGSSRRDRAPGVRQWPALCAGYVLLWAFVYGALRVMRGETPHMYGLGEIWAANTAKHNLVNTPLHIILFLGAFWAFAAMGYRHAPAFLKRVTWVVPPYVITSAMFGMWWEVRLLMPLYPILVGLGLCYLYRGGVNDDGCLADPAARTHEGDRSITTESR